MKKITITLQEASETSGLGVRQLYHYIGMGALKTRKIGKRRLVLYDSLEKFLGEDRLSPNDAGRKSGPDHP